MSPPCAGWPDSPAAGACRLTDRAGWRGAQSENQPCRAQPGGRDARRNRAPAVREGAARAQATFNTLVSAALNRQIKFKTTDKSIMAAGVTDAANKAVKKSKRRRSPLAVAWMSLQARGR